MRFGFWRSFLSIFGFDVTTSPSTIPYHHLLTFDFPRLSVPPSSAHMVMRLRYIRLLVLVIGLALLVISDAFKTSFKPWSRQQDSAKIISLCLRHAKSASKTVNGEDDEQLDSSPSSNLEFVKEYFDFTDE